MPWLKVDEKLCKDCKTCEILLPTFKEEFNGRLFISWNSLKNYLDIQNKIALVISACPNRAITLYHKL